MFRLAVRLFLLSGMSPLPALDFATSSLPAGVAGVAYSQFQIQQDGQGLACCTWAVLSGLPAGMSVDCTWCESLQLDGTPAAIGRYDIVVSYATSASWSRAGSRCRCCRSCESKVRQ